MFIPLLSVSLIGLLVAGRRSSTFAGTGPLVLAGLAGAWVGYLVGAIVGGVVDVILFFQFWPVLIGHVGAVWTARLAVRNRSKALPVKV